MRKGVPCGQHSLDAGRQSTLKANRNLNPGTAPMPTDERNVANQVVADWYFDFVSPFAYLQCEQLAALAPGITVRCKPVLFAGILGAHGQKGPAEIETKRTFTYRFVLWQAKQLGIPLKLPHEHPFNPLPFLRLAIACDCEASAIQRIFRFIWRDGRLPDLPIEWAELTHDLGLPNADARIAEPEVKESIAPLHRRGGRHRCVRRTHTGAAWRTLLGR